jgi:predicted transcriptional regulator of viral defense system
MGWLGRPYYVALLSAAAIHGAAHQQPMRFQVITSLPLRPTAVGRVRIDFHVSRTVESSPIVRMQTDTGYMRVSTPEATAFDLMRFVAACGGLSNIATVVGELAESMAPEALRPLSVERAAPEVQRLGYLLDLVGQERLADPLMRGLAGRRVRPVLLAPGSSAGGARAEPPWRVIVNERIEIDA